jgi:hypothetical protein
VNELFLVAHLFCSFLEEREKSDAAPAHPRDPFKQQRRLWEYATVRGGSDPAWKEAIGGWLEERLRNGDIAELIPWVRALVDALEGADDWHRRLREGLGSLKNGGLNDEECRMVAAYFDRLVERFFPEHPHFRRLDLEVDARVPPIREMGNLRRVWDALYLFHCCYEPAEDHAAFRRRLESCIAIVARRGKTDAAYRSLEAADPANVYEALAHASEEELRGHIESLE